MILLGRAWLLAFSTLALVGAPGCSSDDDGGGSGGGDHGACNALENDGPDVTPDLLTSGTTPRGGIIPDGIYEQTGLAFYPDAGATLPPDPRTFSGVFEIAGDSLEAVVAYALGDDERESRYSATYVTSGTRFTLDYSCPDASIREISEYTATETELRLFYRVAEDTGTAEIVLTKR
jgi:hypothetical protein